MCYKVYILKSITAEKFYISHTKDIYLRLNYHNAGKVRSTKAYKPWKIILIEEFKTKTEARKRELQIKSYKGGEAFKKLI